MGKCTTYQVPIDQIDALIDGKVKLEDVGVRIKPPRRIWVQSDFLRMDRFIYADEFGHDLFVAVDAKTGEILYEKPYLNVQFREKYEWLMRQHRVIVFSA